MPKRSSAARKRWPLCTESEVVRIIQQHRDPASYMVVIDLYADAKRRRWIGREYVEKPAHPGYACGAHVKPTLFTNFDDAVRCAWAEMQWWSTTSYVVERRDAPIERGYFPSQ